MNSSGHVDLFYTLYPPRKQWTEAHRELYEAARTVSRERWAECMLATTSPVLRRLGATLVVFGAQQELSLAEEKRVPTSRRANRQAAPLRVATLDDIQAYANKIGLGYCVRALLEEEDSLCRRARKATGPEKKIMRHYAQRLRTAALRLVLDAGMQRVLVDRRSVNRLSRTR